jgi:NADH-quinone oxidoreductase subunit L
MLDNIWLIPLLPVLGAVLQLLFGRRLSNKAVSAISVGLPGLSFLWALGCYIQFLSLPESYHHVFLKPLYTWLPLGAFHLSDGSLGNLNINVGMQLDPLSCVMMLVVTGVTWRTKAGITVSSATSTCSCSPCWSWYWQTTI